MQNYLPPELDFWELENGFYLKSPVERIGKLLSHYEIYKSIIDLPGDVLELGVFKGSSLVRWATFRNLLENQESRMIYGLDSFGSFPTDNVSKSEGLDFAKKHDNGAGIGISVDDLKKVLEDKNISNVELIKGNVFSTLPEFLAAHPYQKIALLHLDMDIYEPTKFALEQLWDRIVPGGALVVDDYNAIEGATQAVDEFFKSREMAGSYKAAFHKVPTVFIK